MNAATAPRPLTSVTNFSDQKLAEQRAHEPSMEEILASIRRIIADDTAFPLAPKIVAPAPPPAIAAVPAFAPPREAQEPQKPLVPAPQISPQPAPVEATAPPVWTAPASAPPVETFVAAAVPVALAPPPRDVSPPQQEVSVTVAPLPVPKVEAKPIASDVLDLAFPAEAATQGADTGNIAIQMAIHVPAAIPAEPAAIAPPAVEPMPEAVPQWALEQALASESAPEPEFFEAPPPRPVLLARQNPAPQPAIPEALTSPGTEAAVLSSFQTLATSMFLNNSAMVENLTREMLRPMLKTWLDDNLPVMVERLVRAEIERVARGGR